MKKLAGLFAFFILISASISPGFAQDDNFCRTEPCGEMRQSFIKIAQHLVQENDSFLQSKEIHNKEIVIAPPAYRMKEAVQVSKFKGKYYIILHWKLVTLDSSTESAVAYYISHEICHVALSHVGNNIHGDIKEEREADKCALRLVNSSGYNPFSVMDVLEYQKSNVKRQILRAMSENDERRKRKLREAIGEIESDLDYVRRLLSDQDEGGSEFIIFSEESWGDIQSDMEEAE